MKGFKLSPSGVAKGGSQLENLGSKADQHGTNVASTHQKIASSGSGKSSVVKMFTTLATKSGNAFDDVFRQISRVSRGAGGRLKSGSRATAQNETNVESSFKKISSPTPDSHDRPRGPQPQGHSAGEQAETSSAAPATPHRAPTPHGQTGSTSPEPEPSGHESPVGKAPEPKPKVAPAPDRLSSWLGNAGTPEVMPIKSPRIPPAQQHFGDTGHDQMYDIEHESQDYEGNGSGARPTKGGRFQTAFGQKGDKHSAVVMETYVAGGEHKPSYTASDGFLHQWGAAHAGFNAPGSPNKKASAIENHLLDSDTSYSDRLPNKLPDTIYHQNISGDGPKHELGNIMVGKQNPHQLSSDELNQVMKTDNGKSVNNIVRTYNDVKGDNYGITGGAVGQDAQGNYHLKFDIGKK